MQPYFFPYLGYWQLIASVDTFILLENVQFPKGGWINRNYLLGQNVNPELISVPLERASTFAPISERMVSDVWFASRKKTLRRIQTNYRSAPFLDELLPWLESNFFSGESRLTHFLRNQIEATVHLLSLRTKIVSEESLGDFSEFGRVERVLRICAMVGASAYVNLPGGKSLYRKSDFAEIGLRLGFIKPPRVRYQQATSAFVPDLSIIDALLWQGPEKTAEALSLPEVEWV